MGLLLESLSLWGISLFLIFFQTLVSRADFQQIAVGAVLLPTKCCPIIFNFDLPLGLRIFIK